MRLSTSPLLVAVAVATTTPVADSSAAPLNFTVHQRMTWDDANDHCELLGGRLAEPRDAATTAALLRIMSQNEAGMDDTGGIVFWLGGRRGTGDVWSWTSDGTELFAGDHATGSGPTNESTYLNWAGPEPKLKFEGTDFEDYCIRAVWRVGPVSNYWRGGFPGGWRVGPCRWEAYFVCEHHDEDRLKRLCTSRTCVASLVDSSLHDPSAAHVDVCYSNPTLRVGSIAEDEVQQQEESAYCPPSMWDGFPYLGWYRSEPSGLVATLTSKPGDFVRLLSTHGPTTISTLAGGAGSECAEAIRTYLCLTAKPQCRTVPRGGTMRVCPLCRSVCDAVQASCSRAKLETLIMVIGNAFADRGTFSAVEGTRMCPAPSAPDGVAIAQVLLGRNCTDFATERCTSLDPATCTQNENGVAAEDIATPASSFVFSNVTKDVNLPTVGALNRSMTFMRDAELFDCILYLSRTDAQPCDQYSCPAQLVGGENGLGWWQHAQFFCCCIYSHDSDLESPTTESVLAIKVATNTLKPPEQSDSTACSGATSLVEGGSNTSTVSELLLVGAASITNDHILVSEAFNKQGALRIEPEASLFLNSYAMSPNGDLLFGDRLNQLTLVMDVRYSKSDHPVCRQHQNNPTVNYFRSKKLEHDNIWPYSPDHEVCVLSDGTRSCSILGIVDGCPYLPSAAKTDALCGTMLLPVGTFGGPATANSGDGPYFQKPSRRAEDRFELMGSWLRVTLSVDLVVGTARAYIGSENSDRAVKHFDDAWLREIREDYDEYYVPDGWAAWFALNGPLSLSGDSLDLAPDCRHTTEVAGVAIYRTSMSDEELQIIGATPGGPTSFLFATSSQSFVLSEAPGQRTARLAIRLRHPLPTDTVRVAVELRPESDSTGARIEPPSLEFVQGSDDDWAQTQWFDIIAIDDDVAQPTAFRDLRFSLWSSVPTLWLDGENAVKVRLRDDDVASASIEFGGAGAETQTFTRLFERPPPWCLDGFRCTAASNATAAVSTQRLVRGGGGVEWSISLGSMPLHPVELGIVARRVDQTGAAGNGRDVALFVSPSSVVFEPTDWAWRHVVSVRWPIEVDGDSSVYRLEHVFASKDAQYSPLEAILAIDVSATQCEKGYVVRAADGVTCVACPAGTAQNGTMCEACAIGTVSREASSMCDVCEEGTEANANQTSCVVAIESPLSRSERTYEAEIGVVASVLLVGIVGVFFAHRRITNRKLQVVADAAIKKSAMLKEAMNENAELKVSLEAATKVVADVMDHGGALLQRFSLKYTDLDFGLTRHKLGEGSFGTVFRAKFRGVHDVAVKSVRIRKVTPIEIKRFKSEIAIMAPLSHVNLVRLWGGVWNEGADKLCIVVEFCHHGTLVDYLGTAESTWKSPNHKLALDIAHGLAYLHHDLTEPLIHRDVKPENVLVSSDGTAKLADFGESTHFDTKLASRQEERGDEFADAITMTMVGTRLYCAPEVLLQQRYNESADTYSFSLVLLCLAAEDIKYVVTWSRKNVGPTQIHNVRPTVPPALETARPSLVKLIRSMWDHDYRARPSMRQVVASLGDLESEDTAECGKGFENRNIASTVTKSVFATTATNDDEVEQPASMAEAKATIQDLRYQLQKAQREIASLNHRLQRQDQGAESMLVATMRSAALERSLPPLQTIRAAATERREARVRGGTNTPSAQPLVLGASTPNEGTSTTPNEASVFAEMLRTMRDAVEAPPSLALVEAAPTAELTLEEVLSNGGEAFGEVGEAFFPMLRKLQSDESTADFVEAFMAAHLPKGSEVLVPMFRQLLEPIARDVRSAARMATQGTVLRLVIGLCITYGDLITDVLMCVQLESEGSDLFGYAVAFIVLPLVMQAIGALFLFQQDVTDVLFALIGLKPVVDSYRVWTGAAALELHAFKTTPESILALTKMIESAFEGFPQGALQLLYLITTSMQQWKALNFISLASSLGAIAFALTTGTIDVDRDEHHRRNAPWLFGFTGNAREGTPGQRLARYAGLFLFYVGYLGAILLGLVAAASTNVSAVAAALASIFGAYLGVKWWSGEFFLFLMPHHLWRRRSRYTISVFFHLFMLGFLLAAPAPIIRIPGFVNPHVFARAILGNLLVFSPLCLLTFHAWPSEGCGRGSSYTLGEANQTLVNLTPLMSCVDSDGLFVVWACLASLSLVGMLWFWKYGMVRAYLGTFYKMETYRSQTRKYISNEFDSFVGQSISLKSLEVQLTARNPSYWPEDLTSTPLFKIALPSWPEGKPEWMTDEWKRNLPSKWRGKLGLVVEKQ